ncbi:hypothetical protein [Wocania ichthyoenteri]|uniref:glucosamine inositolphosphorylceramide transferase family protein n=1 Tax=Wocania ichthyoenteri TaxID=1230531 RepID=UPI00068A1F78|nr:hypothetical protein [Wocania ichthyoenteri]
MMKNKKIKASFIVDDNSIEFWKIESIKKLLKNEKLIVDKIYLVTNLNKTNKDKRSKLFLALYKIILYLEVKLFKLTPKIISNFSLYDFIEFKDKIKKININDFNDLARESHQDFYINFTSLSSNNFKKYFQIKNVWSVLAGTSVFSNDFPGLEEVIEQHNTFRISIVNKQSKDSNKINILQESYSRVDKTHALRTMCFAYAKIPNMLNKSINCHLNSCIEKDTEEQEIYLKKKNKNIILYTCKILLKYIRKVTKKINSFFFIDQWILLFQITNSEKNNNNFNFSTYKEILPPLDRIWADPFVYEKNGIFHIFIEEMLIKEGKGYISHFTINKEGVYTKPQKIIEESYHLSYPYLFEDKGYLYMIPETNNNKTVSLYKCTDFPYKWEFEMHLIEDIDANDTSLLFKDGMYWLFTNVRTNRFMSCDDELHIFYSKSLLSKSWQSHIQNPVVSDVRYSRPAGKLFLQNNNMVRPAQNCSKHYGYGLNFQLINKLNPNEYSEVEFKKVKPNWSTKIKSVHTFNQSFNLSIIDAQKRRFKY